MNLELPFLVSDPADLEVYLAEIDRALDALFLDEVRDTLDRIRAERRDVADDAAAA